MRSGNASQQQDLFADAPVWWEGLTGRRRLFVEYYCTDSTCFLNATAAFYKAYNRPGKELSDLSIQSNAFRLLKDPKIREAVNKLLRVRQNREDNLNEFKLFNLLKTLAFYNPSDIVNEYGNLKKPLAELGELAMCVAGIEPGRNGTKIKLYDRTKAKEMLARYLELVRPAESTAIINPVMYLSDKDKAVLLAEAGSSHLPAAAVAAEDAEYRVMGGA
jgi:hypothetical protein